MREERIRQAVQVLSPLKLEIENESHMHSGPRTESHYKLLIVSEDFAGLNRVARQRRVNALLQSEFDSGMHALSLRCLTPEEASGQLEGFQSPSCASSTRSTDS